VIGYTGEYLVSMDDKGRLAIPAKLRKARPMGVSPKKLVKSYVLAQWYEGCLGLFIESQWEEKLSMLLKKGASFKKSYRTISRRLSTRAFEVEPDAQGRITIPKRFIEAAGLGSEILFTGVMQHIEIWNPERFEKFIKESPSMEDIAEDLSEE
jgi:transcriptional regulator MraZ